MPIAYLTHIQSFCASHRLHNPSLSDEENRKHFGKCNNLNSHGHNYKIEATVFGEVDPTLGFVINLVDVKRFLLQVIEPLDHKRLDLDIDYFARPNVVASAENIAIYIWDEMSKLLPPEVKLYNIRVHETERNFVDYRG